MSDNVIFGGLGIYPDEATERAYRRAAFDLLEVLETLVERDRAEVADKVRTLDSMSSDSHLILSVT